MPRFNPGEMVECYEGTYRVSHYCNCEEGCDVVFIEDSAGVMEEACEGDISRTGITSFFSENEPEKGFSKWIKEIENVTD